MKLNLDCVRSVLLCVEEHTDLRTMCVFVDTGLDAAMRMIGEPANILDYQQELLADFDNDELIYHVNYCVEAGLLKKSDLSRGEQIFISDLTPKGHEFLNNIREPKIWTGVKGVAAKIGAKSLSAVAQIAANAIKEIIKAQFAIGGSSFPA